MSRNICVTIDEWNYIKKQIKNNALEIPPRHYLINNLKNPNNFTAINFFCKKYWIDQDMYNVMDNMYNFIGFVLNHCENIKADTTLQEWETIMKK